MQANVTQPGPKQQKAEAQALPPGQQTPKPAGKPTPCQNIQTHEDSDLCAQWISATAARTEASWESSHYSVELWGAAGLAVSLILSAAAAIQGFRAFRSTKRTEVAQTRAYLFPDGAAIAEGHMLAENAEYVPGVLVAIKNFGNTPARNVRHWCGLVLAPNDEFDPPEIDMSGMSGTAYPPQATQTYVRPLTDQPVGVPPFWTTICLTEPAKDEIRNNQLGLMLYGRIEYVDVFKQARTTDYRLMYSGQWPPPPDMRMIFCPKGNDSD